jgi:hypothetical protein
LKLLNTKVQTDKKQGVEMLHLNRQNQAQASPKLHLKLRLRLLKKKTTAKCPPSVRGIAQMERNAHACSLKVVGVQNRSSAVDAMKKLVQLPVSLIQ